VGPRRKQPRVTTIDEAVAPGYFPLIAIIIVTWNSAAHLPALLATIPAGLCGLRFQLVIADNASADDSVAIARRLAPDCVVVQTGRNAGYAGGINAGLAAVDGYDAALVLNPDIHLSGGSVARLYAALSDRVGVAVPRIHNADGSLALSLRRTPTIARAFGEAIAGERAGRFSALGETVVDKATYATTGPVDWATGAAMLISARCLAQCGPWDEEFFLYCEETEFALRARDQGFETRYVPDAEVVHQGGDSRISPRLWTLLEVNRVRLYRKRHTAAATAVFWSAVVLGQSSRAALGHARSRRAAAALVRRSTWMTSAYDFADAASKSARGDRSTPSGRTSAVS
jgi:N-acetylglucosaminyl-diphospho-decaprenol L-rhamnosyltransferase